MIIACATDSNYAELTGAMLRSIAVNGDVPEAEIVVCGDRLSPRERSWIVQSASGLNVRFIDIEGAARARIAHLKTTHYWTMSTYTRLLIPELLSDVTGRILYLDVDIVVNRSLRPLFDMPLDGKTIAAVPNAGDPDSLARLNRTVGRPSDSVNVNAGVLVIDLDRWRELDITDKCLYVIGTAPILPLADQDAINAILGEDMKLLSRAWNFSSINSRNFNRNDYADANIVHFILPIKPNRIECQHPARDLFMMHRANTPWGNQPLTTRQPRGIRRLFLFLQWKLFPDKSPLRPATRLDATRFEQAKRRE